MNSRTLVRPACAALMAALLALGAGAALAADSGAAAPAKAPPANLPAGHPPTATPPVGDPHAPAHGTKKTAAVPSKQQIDINSASKAQLGKLPGIGPVEADKIIAGRPYVSKADLVTKNVLVEGQYVAIRYRIIAIPPGKAATKAKQ